MKFMLTALLDIGDNMFDPSDPEADSWFHSVLHGEDLSVHSDEVGDSIGSLRVMTANRCAENHRPMATAATTERKSPQSRGRNEKSAPSTRPRREGGNE